MVSHIESLPDSSKLQNNLLFAGLPVELVNTIGTDVDLFRFDSGDVVFNEGESGDCLYLVVEGAIRISKLGRGGRSETLGVIQRGSFFGEMALIDGQPRSAQATAAEPTILGSISAKSFAKILETAPHSLHQNFLRSVVERLRGINSHFIQELMRNERISLVGTMSNSIIHDLKCPIQVLMGCTSFIASRTKDPEIIQFTEIMEKATGSMVDMVQELLDFARGNSSLQLQRLPAAAAIERLNDDLVHLVPRNVHVVREVGFCDDVNIDLGRFCRVLLNLIKNSMEAMPDGGLLRIGLVQESGRAIFRVTDTGCGIAPDLQAKIFEPFVSYGKSKGTGLGMAIAKSVVESHGGSISLQSTVGMGTCIEVSLPVVIPGAAPL